MLLLLLSSCYDSVSCHKLFFAMSLLNKLFKEFSLSFPQKLEIKPLEGDSIYFTSKNKEWKERGSKVVHLN